MRTWQTFSRGSGAKYAEKSDRSPEDGMPGSTNLAALERELEQLKQQLPRHSISPALQARIDELEEQIVGLKEAAKNPPEST